MLVDVMGGADGMVTPDGMAGADMPFIAVLLNLRAATVNHKHNDKPCSLTLMLGRMTT